MPCGRAAVLLLIVTSAAPAWAQSDAPLASAPASSGARDPHAFLPRADFTFAWGSLLTTDRRFDWQAEVGFDLDVYDYRTGRLRFRADYEAMLGRERRRYDLNQGNYAFEVSGSARMGRAEVAVLSQHVSRHVVDRDNQPAISWNTVGVRVQSAWTRAGGFNTSPPAATNTSRVDGEIEVARAMQQAYVDYAWISRVRVSWRQPLSPRLALAATATGEVIGVQRAILNRERVCGGRIEGALRVRGGAAAMEIFAGYERRIDAYATDRFRVRWFTAGFRITTSAW